MPFYLSIEKENAVILLHLNISSDPANLTDT